MFSKTQTDFWPSIRVPVRPFLVIVTVVGSLAAGFWWLATTRTESLDVSWIYYPNTVIVYGLWVGVILLFMFFRFRNPNTFAKVPPSTRFLCLIPAYNEACVISNSVTNLLRQNYPRRLFEVVVIVDGTDQTEDIARSLGASVFKTPSPASGKHRALAYAFNQLISEDDDRFVVVFDADNVMSEDYLQKMNDAIVTRGHRCLQGVHDVLNTDAHWVSKQSPFGDRRAKERIAGILLHDQAGLPSYKIPAFKQPPSVVDSLQPA